MNTKVCRSHKRKTRKHGDFPCIIEIFLLQWKPLITGPVITGIFQIPVFLPLCLCKSISPITGSQEASIGYSKDFVAN